MIVEVGIKLDYPLEYYQDILQKAGAVNTFNCETRDIYWSNKTFDGMTENEIKSSCVRYRMCRGFNSKEWDCVFQNYQLFNPTSYNSFKCKLRKLSQYESVFIEQNWQKVFDTYKKDYQYAIGNMKSRIQLQDIRDVGLLLYYDNPDYYHLPEDVQRKALIDELNSYGFNISTNTMGLDKLRTLWYGKEHFSWNQNK